MFDPWTADVEAVVAAQVAEPGYAGWRTEHPKGPLHRWHVAQQVLEARERIEAGDGLFLIGAVNACISLGMVAPDWLADVFDARARLVATAEVMSWDDPRVFGRPYPKGTQKAALQRFRADAEPVYQAVVRLLRSGEPLHRNTFEAVGAELGIAATRVEELYRHVEKQDQEWEVSPAEVAYREACRRLRVRGYDSSALIRKSGRSKPADF